MALRTLLLRPQRDNRAVCTATAKLGLGYCSPELTGASQIHLFKVCLLFRTRTKALAVGGGGSGSAPETAVVVPTLTSG